MLLDWDSAATPCLLMSIPRSLPSDSEVEALDMLMDNATSQSLRHRLSQHWRTFRFSQYGRQTKERARVERATERGISYLAAWHRAASTRMYDVYRDDFYRL